jgi:hypothetical protein
LVWLLFLLGWHPHFQEPRWIIVLLLFSPLVLMPLSSPLWDAGSRQQRRQACEIPSASLLAAAFIVPPGWPAALAASPWLMVRGLAALEVLGEWRQKRPASVAAVCVDCARLFPAIGAAWLLADRAGWRPFGFDALVVLLTAAHFHHAGFTLPLLAGLLGRVRPGRAIRFCSFLILAGVPLVAAGITFTHFAVWQGMEPFAALVLASGSFGFAMLQIGGTFYLTPSGGIRAGFVVSGASLGVAMLLAAGYGLRLWWPGASLSMPSMWAVHGTLNVFGFGLMGILAWRALFAARAEN